MTSDSALRFRHQDEVIASLAAARYVVDEVRQAADRPGRELVFIARRAGRWLTGTWPWPALCGHQREGRPSQVGVGRQGLASLTYGRRTSTACFFVRAGSGGQPQHQRGHGQQEEHGRRGERVVACAQVGDDGTDEEHDDANCRAVLMAAAMEMPAVVVPISGTPMPTSSPSAPAAGGRPTWSATTPARSRWPWPSGPGDSGRRRPPPRRRVGDEQAADNDVRGEHGEPFIRRGSRPRVHYLPYFRIYGNHIIWRRCQQAGRAKPGVDGN